LYVIFFYRQSSHPGNFYPFAVWNRQSHRLHQETKISPYTGRAITAKDNEFLNASELVLEYTDVLTLAILAKAFREDVVPADAELPVRNQ